MKGIAAYYASRAVISVAFGVLLGATGTAWWLALLMAALILGWFLWAPHSGRYAVHPEAGITALRRDERTQTVNDKAARNGFVVTMLTVMVLAVYYGRVGPAQVPEGALNLLLILGAVTYFGTDFWLRRTAGRES